jgi:hypothetical protein
VAVFEDKVLRIMSRRKEDEIREARETIYNEEFHDMNSPQNIVRVIKGRSVTI